MALSRVRGLWLMLEKEFDSVTLAFPTTDFAAPIRCCSVAALHSSNLHWVTSSSGEHTLQIEITIIEGGGVVLHEPFAQVLI